MQSTLPFYRHSKSHMGIRLGAVIVAATSAVLLLSACGGGGGGAAPGSVVVTPSTKRMLLGGAQSFSASVPAIWAVTEPGGGAITAAGLYTAPVTPGEYHVVATSQANSTQTGAATVTVQDGDVYVGGRLAPAFDMGVNTSGGRTDWVTNQESAGYMTLAYPAGQQWGAVFMTVGTPTPLGSPRETMDVTYFSKLVLDLKGALGGEQVNVGVKTDTDPDDGLEPKSAVTSLTTDWRTVEIPLASLTSGGYPASRFRSLYVMCELVFELGVPSETIYVRNVRFVK